MDLVLLLARIVLAGVFILACVTKLADRRGSAQAMQEFGVPVAFAPLFGTLLPIAELVVAVALIPTSTARGGALGALILLLLFVAGIGVNLARGKQPDCHCFGQLHSEPVGWPTLTRNGVLAALAAFVLVAGWNDAGLSPIAWLGDLSAIEGVLIVGGVLVLALIAVVGWALVQLLQQNGRLLLRLEALESAVESGTPIAPLAAVNTQPALGLPVGTPAPLFELSDVHGTRVALETLRSPDKPILLLFTDPGCGPCNALLPEIGRWQQEHDKRLTLALVTRGGIEANRPKTAEHGIRHVLIQDDREIAEKFWATMTPAAVLLRPDLTIGSPLAAGNEAIRRMISNTVGTPPARPLPVLNGNVNGNGNGMPKGLLHEPVPDIRLTTLEGEEAALRSFSGEATALLFWSPGCGFCARMLDDLKQVEANPVAGAPRIVLISTGDPERNRAMGLQSTILLDNGFTAGRLFGASGTPSAVMIDKDGKVASTVAVGAPAVLSLVSNAIPASISNRV
ncbi:MAG: MauE/DoxX family redox-associated membrane protein [Thermomicrobiales bacterium]